MASIRRQQKEQRRRQRHAEYQQEELKKLIDEAARRFPGDYGTERMAMWAAREWNLTHTDPKAEAVLLHTGIWAVATTNARQLRSPAELQQVKVEIHELFEQAGKIHPTDGLQQALWVRKQWLKKHPRERAEVIESDNAIGYDLLTIPAEGYHDLDERRKSSAPSTPPAGDRLSRPSLPPPSRSRSDSPSKFRPAIRLVRSKKSTQSGLKDEFASHTLLPKSSGLTSSGPTLQPEITNEVIAAARVMLSSAAMEAVTIVFTAVSEAQRVLSSSEVQACEILAVSSNGAALLESLLTAAKGELDAALGQAKMGIGFPLLKGGNTPIQLNLADSAVPGSGSGTDTLMSITTDGNLNVVVSDDAPAPDTPNTDLALVGAGASPSLGLDLVAQAHDDAEEEFLYHLIRQDALRQLEVQQATARRQQERERQTAEHKTALLKQRQQEVRTDNRCNLTAACNLIAQLALEACPNDPVAAGDFALAQWDEAYPSSTFTGQRRLWRFLRSSLAKLRGQGWVHKPKAKEALTATPTSESMAAVSAAVETTTPPGANVLTRAEVEAQRLKRRLLRAQHRLLRRDQDAVQQAKVLLASDSADTALATSDTMLSTPPIVLPTVTPPEDSAVSEPGVISSVPSIPPMRRKAHRHKKVGKRPERQVKKVCDLLISQAQSTYSNPSKQREWALAQWYETYRECPLGVRWRVFEQATARLEGLSPPPVLSTNPEQHREEKSRRKPYTGRLDELRALSLNPQKRALLRGMRQSEVVADIETRGMRSEIDDLRGELILEAVEIFPDDLGRQLAWVEEQLGFRYRKLPRAVRRGKRNLRRVRDRLIRDEENKADRGSAAELTVTTETTETGVDAQAQASQLPEFTGSKIESDVVIEVTNDIDRPAAPVANQETERDTEDKSAYGTDAGSQESAPGNSWLEEARPDDDDSKGDDSVGAEPVSEIIPVSPTISIDSRMVDITMVIPVSGPLSVDGDENDHEVEFEDDESPRGKKATKRRPPKKQPKAPSRRRRFASMPMPAIAQSEYKMSIGPGGLNQTYQGIALTYLIQAGVEFHAREPKAIVHALPGSIVHSEGSRVIRYPGATVYGPCENAAEERQLEDDE